ncbi:MAG: SulP family inorganic anion transporter [Myxococcota bacterium]
MGWVRFLPLLELKRYRAADLAPDLSAAVTLALVGIPQCIAYALIAGLPPVMGLYAAAVPTIVGALFRSSRHVVTGPTNALSLLVGTAGAAALGLDPVPTALLLAFWVGVMQLAAGGLRLGVLVDYISIPVVMGYITGAGVLIGVGQLKHLTATAPATAPVAGALGANTAVGAWLAGSLPDTVGAWLRTLPDANGWAVATGLVTVAGLVAGRRFGGRRFPAPLVVLGLLTALSALVGARGYGVPTIADLAPIPAGLPPLSWPGGEGPWAWTFSDTVMVLPIAGAATVLSLVESSSLGRAISAKSGQRLDISVEFAGQGLANLAAAFFGAYPTSGSLSRSVLNHDCGVQTRLSGVFNGAIIVLVLLALGPAVNHTPIAALAGLLLVVAYDLVDRPRIRQIFAGRRSDAAAFGATVVGTWLLRLDYAIYLGVALSLFMFLRRARLLTILELVFDDNGRPRELRRDDPTARARRSDAIRLLQVEGELFFGAVGELSHALDEVTQDPGLRVLALRLRGAFGMDVSIARALVEAHTRLQADGRRLMLLDVRPEAMAVLERTGVIAALGADNVVVAAEWFDAVRLGLRRALDTVERTGRDDDGERALRRAIDDPPRA